MGAAVPQTPWDLTELARVLNEGNKKEKASFAIAKAINLMDDPASLSSIAQVANDLGFVEKSSGALDKAIRNATTTAELIRLYGFSKKINNQEKAMASLSKAAEKVASADDVLRVVDVSLEANREDILNGIDKKAFALMDPRGLISLMDMYIANNHRENAVNILQLMIKSVKGDDPERKPKLLRLADIGIDKNMLEQTLNAIQRLAVLEGVDGGKITVSPNRKLNKVDRMPNRDGLELQLYYGMINEELGFRDKAEQSYKKSVGETLRTILSSYGYSVPRVLNNFFLLGELWKESGEYENLEKLDRVYTEIENGIINEQKAAYERELVQLQMQLDDETYPELREKEKRLEEREKELNRRMQEGREGILNAIARMEEDKERLKTEKAEATSEYREIVRKVRNDKRSIYLNIVGIIGSIVFMLAIIAGCVLWAYKRYAVKQPGMRTFAFVVKYIETEGWVRVVSILGLISGIVSVFLAQIALIYNELYARTRALADNTVGKEGGKRRQKGQS